MGIQGERRTRHGFAAHLVYAAKLLHERSLGLWSRRRVVVRWGASVVSAGGGAEPSGGALFHRPPPDKGALVVSSHVDGRKKLELAGKVAGEVTDGISDVVASLMSPIWAANPGPPVP